MSAPGPDSDATAARPGTGDAPHSRPARYVPAAGRRALTGLSDPAIALTTREHAWCPKLQADVFAGLPPSGRLVDVGCGTGTLAIALAAAQEVEMIAVDGDPDALARARAKPDAERVQWRHGLDAVVMTLLLRSRSASTISLWCGSPEN